MIEEGQLQHLDTVPYQSLRRDFRNGVEALQTKLMGLAQPKTVGNESTGCSGFVALLRQLVHGLNESKKLSVVGAWDTVQHTACAALVAELRDVATQQLQKLVSGGSSNQLPLSDESLNAVLRSHQRGIKTLWQRRAVGNESVRKEYWQQLKEHIVREEVAVQQQNARLAEQKLSEALKRWEEWLHDDSGSSVAGERVCEEMAVLMEQMPALPLSRATRRVIESAGKRVSAVRNTQVTATQESMQLQAQLEDVSVLTKNLDNASAQKQQQAEELGRKTAECEQLREALKAANNEIEQTKKTNKPQKCCTVQ